MFILIFSRRSLVDYEDDEDDEDYKPPPRKQKEASEEDEGIMESLRLKRKLPSKDKEPEVAKKQKLTKNSKSKESVFAALCSTLSQAVLPSKKSATNIHTDDQIVEGRMSSSEDNQEDRQNDSRSSSDDSNIVEAEDNHVEKDKDTSDSRSFSDCLHAKSDNIELGGEERPLVPPKSSPEMAVNGS